MTRFLSRAVLAGALLVVALTAAACSTASGAAPGSQVPADPNAVRIVASGQQFTTTDVAAPAGTPFQIVFESQTSDPHNIAISAAGADPVVRSEVFSGPGSETISIPALTAGTYAFKCDVHPGMTGTLTVK